MEKLIQTFQYRVKNPKKLPALCLAVNTVWNYCGDVTRQAQRQRMRWPSEFDLNKFVAGSGKELGLMGDCLQDITKHFVKSRTQAKHRPKWRTSFGSRRSLGWVPFMSGRGIKILDGCVRFNKVMYPIWLDRSIEGKILCGSFNEDSRGRWYVNLVCEVEKKPSVGTEEIGIDLGLKTFATLSTGEKIENGRQYRREEQALATAQRAGRNKRAKSIHAKIKNRRLYNHHVESIKLIRRSRAIHVGNVDAQKLAGTKLAKSLYDVGWSTFRSMLRYKAIRHGVTYMEVDERFTTQTCSSCKTRSGPKGLEGLEVRDWTCSGCGVHHDRDVNAAKNILNSGLSASLQLTGSPSY